ncbi:MAG TPA: DJ-1/PfpI family protein [Solirubrobacterales bacterium]|jgi:transcriptional regulator GlxA family with amidase domain|nr:DJ-1/PfpI family protein [Solirubrobacterales bacterium]
MQIAILLFDRLTALDAIGPYEVLSRLPGAELDFVVAKPGTVRTDTDRLGLEAGRSIAEVPAPDVVLVPGGEGNRPLLRDEPVLAWLRSAHELTRFTSSVCTGALVLGAAGILDGLRATTHWAYLDALSGFGATPVGERVVEDGKVITAAGVSSGIDMALYLAAKLAGEDAAKAIQLGIEYDPEPPFDAGSPRKAPDNVVEAVRKLEDLSDLPSPTR